MANTRNLNLNLNLCFTKIKLPLMFSQSPPIRSTTPTPQTPEDQSRPLPSSSLIIRNFNSLYEEAKLDKEDYTTSDEDNSSSSASAAADFATAFASRRFFFSTPGRSNSIVDSRCKSRGADVTLFGNSIAVPTFSPDPYADFRRSMQEMLEARSDHASKSNNSNSNSNNWEFLHELLLCYLALNPKSTHKFITRAFSDLVVSLMPSPAPVGGGGLENDGVADVCEILEGR
ncbi:hypothetical protein L484_025089 [Morus notabilis]|uniref:Transcription repressor n=1 Tax=Morus notabilis TaxID=981085 RepID=W9QT84_9ROSA|nr:transcription repressor OFP16 [Morus notabilis]EXB39392.1 hypothetical protein L484_025089 [Morus notabilis]